MIKLSHKGLALEHGKHYALILIGADHPVHAIFIDKNKRKTSDARIVDGVVLPAGHFFLTKRNGKYKCYVPSEVRFARLISKSELNDMRKSK